MVTQISRHPLVSFFALAFALTWLLFLPWMASGGEGIPWFTFGPALAGFAIAALTEGWVGVRRILAAIGRWRVAPVWYLVAIGLPLALQLAAVLVTPMFGAAPPNWSLVPPFGEIFAWVAIFLVFSGPLGEEPGWRGYALPKMLERQGALAASLMLGVLWAAWHLPLGLVGDLTVYGSIHAVLAAVVFTWLWQNTGSALLAILMHASHQNSVRYLGRVYEGADQVQQQWIAVALWALVALAIVAIHGRKRFAPKAAA
ncbi:CPBP family intramembrane glutamic endopeptidase [Aminobacter carboxidus]|uniref:CPBP family intramembrane metalloprotease n=1 Tax=Aminobacter carboxidus TaxID=376165 RepID=A0ABR9GXE1_9HYPH|nr:type II CAAX endopeptidase family protein [Aminobacter carboxidus]MBE1208353.1 CPBP family intramembrane metalloprotease [Aminobacter carboxidus]